MLKSKEIAAKVTEMVIEGQLSRLEAAELLEATLRTIHNYVKKYVKHGPEGLIDHRCGHHRKLTSEQVARIVECKVQRPHRSARWIRDWLKLPVSVETVRQTLMKHGLNHADSDVGSRVVVGRKIPIRRHEIYR
jgi:transposase